MWRGKRFDYRRCGGCGCTFADPAPTDAELAAMYSLGEYHDEHYAAFDPDAYRPSLDWLVRHVPRGATLLDVGCGNGAFMTAKRKAGCESVGVDLDPDARASAASRTGLPVQALEEVRASGRRFDVIHLGDVIEHLPAPAPYLRALEPLLRPGGSFFVEGPLESNDSLVFHSARVFKSARRLVGRDRPGDVPPLHLILTTAAAQRAFFTRTLGYRERAFELDETGWPYLTTKPARSARDRVRATVGRAAIVVAAWARRRGQPWGNRFRAVYEAAREPPTTAGA